MEIFLLMIHGTLALSMGLIEKFEGVENSAYLDAGGVPTICAGLTRYPDGSPVRIGDVCSETVCDGYLKSMVEDQYIPKLQRIPGWKRLGRHRQSVLISFAWNMGANFYGSNGFESISRVLRDGASNPEAYEKMPDALMLYNRANGVELLGLTRRREYEGQVWARENDGVRVLEATANTYLKKAAIPGEYLSANALVAFSPGENIRVVATDEIPADTHEWVTLEGTGEKWVINQPQWYASRRREQSPNISGKDAIDWNDFDAYVSKYLTVGEVLQYDSRRKPESGSGEESAIMLLAEQFDAVREAWGGPLGITSGYRPEPINTDIGGVSGSYHAKGMALDIYPVDDSCKAFYKWISRRWSGGLGEGCQKGFVHIDIRDSGKFHPRGGVNPCCIWSY